MLDGRPKHQNDKKQQHLRQTDAVHEYRSVWCTEEIMHKDVMQCHKNTGVHYVMGI